MSSPWKFQAIIGVKAAKQAAANNFWKNNIDLAGGDKTFTQGLSATGNAPATWYWCNTVLEKWQLRKIVEVADANSTDVKIIIWARNVAQGKKIHLTNQMAGRNYITIADEGQTPQDFLNAAGFKIIQEAV